MSELPEYRKTGRDKGEEVQVDSESEVERIYRNFFHVPDNGSVLLSGD